MLYALVKEHLGAFLEHAREAYERPLPKYVVDEFRSYLACGDFSRGFVHVQCSSCGDAMAVAFSCKMRGRCPSCAGRRMAGSAADLVDRVLSSRPVRQYVLAFPYELSGLAATRPEVLAALSRIFWESLRLRYQGWAKAAVLATLQRVETGAVTEVHRAGASLNVHVHFHLLCLDGVYVDEGETLRFEPAPRTDTSRAHVDAGAHLRTRHEVACTPRDDRGTSAPGRPAPHRPNEVSPGHSSRGTHVSDNPAKEIIFLPKATMIRNVNHRACAQHAVPQKG